MQTIEAAALRMREARDADAPPPPPAYSPRLRPAPAVLGIKTRVLGELAEPAPAAAAPAAVHAALIPPRSWRGMAASAAIGATFGALLQASWHGATGPAEPAASVTRVAATAPSPTMAAADSVDGHVSAALPGAPGATGARPVRADAPAGPIPAPAAPAAAPVGDAVSEVREHVMQWVAAWSARDVERYLAFYARDFAPAGGLSRAAWETQRRARIAGAATIRVEVRDVRVEPEGADRAVVRFAQDYASGGYRETGTRKRLVMRKDEGRWRIFAEGTDA